MKYIIIALLAGLVLLGCPGVERAQVPPGNRQEITEAEKEEATEKLFTAVKVGDVGQVNEAIKAGANVNTKDADSWTPLMWGAWRGNKGTVQALIARGVYINARD